MQIFLSTSVSSTLLFTIFVTTITNNSIVSSPLPADNSTTLQDTITSSTESNNFTSMEIADAICNTHISVANLKYLSVHDVDCKSESREFWSKNCRCSVNRDEDHCPPQCPEEMTTHVFGRSALSTTTLLSTILLSTISPNSTWTSTPTPSILASTAFHQPTSASQLTSTTFHINTTATAKILMANSTSTNVSHHEELPNPSKLTGNSNTNFIRFG